MAEPLVLASARNTRAPIVAVFAAASWLAAFTPDASAQSFVVDVKAAESGAPIPGAFVSLLDTDGHVLSSQLADDSGRAVLVGRGPGNYQVRAELIGRETRVSELLVLGEGASERVSLVLPSYALPLSEIRVDASSRCRVRPDEAAQLGRVWAEARKAVAVQAWSEAEGVYELAISTYERDLDAQGRTVEREDRRAMRRLTRVPFASLPPQDLARHGFVRRREDGGHQYFSPDAAVLLSDLFLETHCLRLTRSPDRPGSIGLAFEPVGATEHPDIRGTFWLDEASAALRAIEYDYTRAPYPEAERVAGGRVEFASLPNGAWIIERWSIRAPLLGRDHGVARAGDSGIRVIGIRETGGEVLAVSTLDRRQVVSRPTREVILRTAVGPEVKRAPALLQPRAVRAAGQDEAGRGGDQGVQGRVLDADSGSPVPAAELVLSSGSGEVVTTGTTNERGFFRLKVPRSGPYLLSARALGYAAIEDAAVDVRPERLTVVEMQMPAEAVELEPIIVTTEARSFHLEMEGFYRRRDEGLGVHMTPEQLEKRQPVRATDMFFGMPGVRVIEPAGGGRGRAVLLSRWRDPRDSACWPMVYVDRHLVSTGGIGGPGAEPLAIDELVATDDVLAIEVFRSPAEIPSEFSGPNAGCGVVVLWTRRAGAG